MVLEYLDYDKRIAMIGGCGSDRVEDVKICRWLGCLSMVSVTDIGRLHSR